MIIPLLVALLAAAPESRATTADADLATLKQCIAEMIPREFPNNVIILPRDASHALRQWVIRHGQALHGIGPSGLPEQPWGQSAAFVTALKPGSSPTWIYLYVFDRHASGKLVVYGLTGGVHKAHLLADRTEAALPMERVANSLVVTLPKEPVDPLATVVVLEMDGRPQVADLAARPGDDGRIVMHARDAVVHGRTVRYEPEPQKDTIGYWSDASDWVSWQFEVAEAGTYAVDILQGCGKGSGGSVVNFSVGGRVLEVTVQDTGGFQNFVERRIGTFTFDKPGRFTLEVKPVRKAGVAVMDLRSVTLAKDK